MQKDSISDTWIDSEYAFSELMHYIKVKSGTSKSAEHFKTPWGPFSANLKATANKPSHEEPS